MSFDPQIPTKSFDPPPEGTHRSELVDVIYCHRTFQDKDAGPAVKFIWELEAVNEKTGEPVLAMQTYGFSLGSKSKLRKMFVGWRGADFTAAELATWTLSRVKQMVGSPCKLVIVHEVKKDGGVWGNIAAVRQLSKANAYVQSGKYKRSDKDQDAELSAIAQDSQMTAAPAVMQPQGPEGVDEPDNSLPF